MKTGAAGKMRRDESGTAMVELGLVLPVFILVLIGIAEFGWLLNAYVTVQHAAREGARLGIAGADDSAIVARVESAAYPMDPSRLTVSISPEPSLRLRGQPMTVTVQYAHRFMTPLIGSVLGETVTVTGSIDMRVE
ncbi:MAG: pilus assembly protein [Firmicutes bacterium]|nr:pilus assembly protein [Bacillota bacterium]